MDYVSLAITAAMVSLVVQIIKSTVGTSRFWTIGVLIALSLVGGGVYYQLHNTALWEACLEVLVFANGIYSFLIRQFENA